MEYVKYTLKAINPIGKKMVAAVPKAKYRTTTSTDDRIKKYHEIMTKATSDTQIPLIVEKGKANDSLPDFGKSILLVPKTVNFAELHYIIKQRIKLNDPNQTFFILINGYYPPDPSSTLESVYENPSFKSDDGFLYIEIFNHSTFG